MSIQTTTDDITLANLELHDVVGVYNSFPTAGSRSYYQCDNDPTSLGDMMKSHFKGIASYGGKLIFTHTNLTLVGHNNNGKFLIADQIGPGQSQGRIAATLDTLYPGWPHPCSSQACGSFMAMGIQQDESGPGSKKSVIQILDIRNAKTNQDFTVLAQIVTAPDDGVNGVGMTKESGADGKYIVAGINGTTLRVHKSRSSSLLTDAHFDPVFQQTIADSGPGLALVTQTDCTIFMFALNADAGGPSTITLYRIDLTAAPGAQCTKVGTKTMTMAIPGMSDSVTLLNEYALIMPLAAALLYAFGAPMLNSSFRWGKGLAITSPYSIEVYASDRNVLPLSQIPVVGSQKDFSLVTWSNTTAPKQIGLPITASGTWGGSAVGSGMILLEPVTADAVLTEFNIMLWNRDAPGPGVPLALVFDRKVDSAGATILTVVGTSAVLDLNGADFNPQSIALATPLLVKAGQLVGFVNNGPGHTLSVNWVDGQDHHVFWGEIPTGVGNFIKLEAGNPGTPCNACGWNFSGKFLITQ